MLISLISVGQHGHISPGYRGAYGTALAVDLRVELGAPACVLDVQDALVQDLQPLQAPLQVPLDLQHVAAELRALAATEDGQRPLLAVLPAGKLVLTVTHLV